MKTFLVVLLLSLGAWAQSTTNFQLNLPVYNSTGWNTKLNQNFSIMDDLLAGSLQPKTIGYTLKLSDSGAVFTNSSSIAEVDLTLPACALTATSDVAVNTAPRYAFYVDATQTMKVIATSGNKIRYVNLLSAANGNVTTNTTGNFIVLQCIGNSSADGVAEWVVKDILGTWTLN